MTRHRTFEQIVTSAGSLFALFATAACSGAGSSPNASPVALPGGTRIDPGIVAGLPLGARRIQHVVIIVQEGHSFNDLFEGYPGAVTASTGKNSFGQTIVLVPQPLALEYSWDTTFPEAVAAIDYPKGEAMDGFDQIPCIAFCLKIPPCNRWGCNSSYQYTRRSDVQTFWDMAEQYVVADHFFASQLGGSFQGHQYLIAAQAERTWGYPRITTSSGCDGGTRDTVDLLDASTKPARPTTRKIRVCFDPPVTKATDETIADELDAKNLTWRYYAAGEATPGYIWSAYDAIDHIRNGPGWSRVISPPSQFIADVAAGKLANVTWIAPVFQNSDDPGSASANGPAWVASLVDAVGNSQFWGSSAIFVTWDHWGGQYDPVPPPLLDYDGLGIRVPLITISPYALENKVAKTQYEFGSILKFVEQIFGLQALAASDRRAADFGANVFNFKQKPRSFVGFSVTR